MPGLYCERVERVSEDARAQGRAAREVGGTHAVGLLDTAGLGRRLAGGLGGELLARGLATGGLASGLLRAGRKLVSMAVRGGEARLLLLSEECGGGADDDDGGEGARACLSARRARLVVWVGAQVRGRWCAKVEQEQARLTLVRAIVARKVR